MKFLVHGYSVVEDKEVKRTYRGDLSPLPDSVKLTKGGVNSNGKNKKDWNSLTIKGRTSKQGNLEDNDVDLILYDFDMNDCAALILKLFEMMPLAEDFHEVGDQQQVTSERRDRTKLMTVLMSQIFEQYNNFKNDLYLDPHISAIDGIRKHLTNASIFRERYRTNNQSAMLDMWSFERTRKMDYKSPGMKNVLEASSEEQANIKQAIFLLNQVKSLLTRGYISKEDEKTNIVKFPSTE